jgi:hypothetical protein
MAFETILNAFVVCDVQIVMIEGEYFIAALGTMRGDGAAYHTAGSGDQYLQTVPAPVPYC